MTSRSGTSRTHRSSIERVCPTCGQAFRPWASTRPGRHCSKACSGASRRVSPEKKRWVRFAASANATARKYGIEDRLAHDATPPLGPCVYCDGEATGWDHVVAMANGGPNTVANLVPSCLPCNQSKNRHEMPTRRSVAA